MSAQPSTAQDTTPAVISELPLATIRAIVATLQAESPAEHARIARGVQVLLTSQIVETPTLGRYLVQANLRRLAALVLPILFVALGLAYLAWHSPDSTPEPSAAFPSPPPFDADADDAHGGDARGAPGQHTALGTRLTPPPASFTGGRRSDPPFRWCTAPDGGATMSSP